MPTRRIAYAPASISNIGPGFDILGIAIAKPGDVVIAEKRREPGLVFSTQGSTVLTPNNETNVAQHVAELMRQELRIPFGIALTLQKHMPLGSGLGSSGASAAGAAYAINGLLDKPLTKHDLIPFAMQGEKLASGAAHADNVAPSLLGGVCLIRSYQPLDIIQLPTITAWYWIVVHPALVIYTQAAREVLPKTISLTTLVQQTGNLAGVITALLTADNALLQRALHDVIVEPVRAQLITGFSAVKTAALQAGALACSLSGSGPSVFAIATTQSQAEIIAASMQRIFQDVAGVAATAYVSQINDTGAMYLDDPT